MSRGLFSPTPIAALALSAAKRVSAFASRRMRLVAIAFASAILALIHVTGAADPLDNSLAALRADMTQRAPTGDVVIVEIDTPSLRAAGEWPWPRQRFAQAIVNLREAGVGLIGFDVDFTARSSEADDLALRDAIAADPGSIVLPTFLQRGGDENAPLSSLSEDAVVASVNIPIDPDGRVRRYFRGFDHEGHYRASLAGVLANAPYGDASSFLVDYSIRHEQIDRLSFEDIYRGDFDPERVRGRTVVIGSTALELGDEFSTPVDPALPGIVVHALAFESLRQGRALIETQGIVELAVALLVLTFLWPRSGRLDLSQFFIRQTAVLSAMLLGSLVLQMAAPLSINLALVLVAQLFCVAASVNQELERRAADLIRQREAHLTHVALHDPETDLPNRRAMLEALREHLNHADRGKVVVALTLGIDRFPTLRGAIGYSNANKLVRNLASRVAASSHQPNVYHISTSILGVVVVTQSESKVTELCVQNHEPLSAAVPVEDQEFDIQIRWGVAGAMPGEKTAEALMEHATIALDQARLNQRRLVRYDAQEIADPAVQLALISDVRRGLDQGEFRLSYQAKANARDGAIVGAEALMRWRHPCHGDISPDDFIRIAEETGAIDDLTRWAIAQAIADQAVMRANGVDLFVSVNVSARSLADSEFCSFVIEATNRAQAKLCLEITETAIISDPPAALSSIAAFRAAGIRIAIDDYGSGLSSLAYLKQLAADELKLDKSLVGELKSSGRDRLILKSTIDLAHSLGMSVVAEGVEDAAELALLAGMGCDTVQGFLISRPIAADAFLRLADRRQEAPVPTAPSSAVA
jgi:EAL domain-containing protein (putative c-di-GMP-specific phosphodiesterase class I)/CHASE2 domain-containing sensor protein/GGDEF domain-containing protein